MIFLVDAFNLIYKFPDLEENMYRGDLTEARRGLLSILLKYKKSSRKPAEMHVFFDGKKKHGDETRRETVSGMETYYSIDLSADHLIKEFIKRNPAPGNLTLVTSDKDIIFYAKKYKCMIHTSEEFSKMASQAISDIPDQNSEEEKPDKVDDVSFWMEMFKKRK